MRVCFPELRNCIKRVMHLHMLNSRGDASIIVCVHWTAVETESTRWRGCPNSIASSENICLFKCQLINLCTHFAVLRAFLFRFLCCIGSNAFSHKKKNKIKIHVPNSGLFARCVVLRAFETLPGLSRRVLSLRNHDDFNF